jgi:aldose 1-epimerase
VTRGVSVRPFGDAPDGAVELYTLRNASGTEMRVMTYGGVITHMLVPDRDGALGNIVLGYDDLEGYLRKSPHFGALTGRFANRIADGHFVLDGVPYQLERNKNGSALHGGSKGFDRVIWGAEPVSDVDSVGLRLHYFSPDGDQGYPGALDVTVMYTLTDRNAVLVDYSATASRATPINLTQHSYFNLAGHGDMLDHVLTLRADRYTPVTAAVVPTGAIAPVAGTPLDFRTAAPIGARIDAPFEQLQLAGGYDHNFVINRHDDGLVPAARVYAARSGRTLEVLTTEPGVQLYTGNGLDGSIVGSGGQIYGKYAGLCLETQHFPDSPNQPQFPSTILRPGSQFRSQTVFQFGVES